MLIQFVFSGLIELNQVRQQTVAHLRLQSTNIYLCRSWCCAGLQQMFKYSEKHESKTFSWSFGPGQWLYE